MARLEPTYIRRTWEAVWKRHNISTLPASQKWEGLDIEGRQKETYLMSRGQHMQMSCMGKKVYSVWWMSEKPVSTLWIWRSGQITWKEWRVFGFYFQCHGLLSHYWVWSRVWPVWFTLRREQGYCTENGLRWRCLVQRLLSQCWGEMTSMTTVRGVLGFSLREEAERPKQGAFSMQQRRKHNSGC